jgi:hypothetical protein
LQDTNRLTIRENSRVIFQEKVSKGVDSKVCQHANALKIVNRAIRFLHSETSMDAQKACARKSTNSDRHEDEAHLYTVRQDQATEHTVANLGPSDQSIWGQPSYADPSDTDESFSISPSMEATDAEALNKIGTSHVDTTMARAENLRWEDCPYFEGQSLAF